MKLFKSLLVAPATIGLLAPFSVFAGETNLNDISKYSNPEQIDLANAFENHEPKDEIILAGGEGLVETDTFDGGFSETTTASFSTDMYLGAVDGGTATYLGLIAVIFATVNVVGGFMVTDRMLKMFKRK